MEHLCPLYTWRRFPLTQALIHRSAWKVNSQKLDFRFTEFSEVEVAGRLSYVNLGEPYLRTA
jgi:hypothetical protein